MIDHERNRRRADRKLALQRMVFDAEAALVSIRALRINDTGETLDAIGAQFADISERLFSLSTEDES